MDLRIVKTRVETLIAQGAALRPGQHGMRSNLDVNALFDGAVSLISSVYGADSPQMRGLNTVLKEVSGKYSGVEIHYTTAMGALRNLRDEIETGLLLSLRLHVAGAIVSDFVALAREHLGTGNEGGKNVAAVLAAAAFEDAARRLGEERAGVVERIKLEQVLQALKAARILTDAQFGIAQSYLQFRNDALHADWAKVERASVASVLGFTEELILGHFG